jgi:isopentenyldiphosphate isomerase
MYFYDGTVAPNPAEADRYQWARIEDVEADVAAMPRRFSVWFWERSRRNGR